VKDGLWSVPGGHVERGETSMKGARRELQEETGYRVKLRSLRLLRVRNGFSLYFAGVPREFSPVLDGEHDSCGWFHPSRHPQPLHPGLGGVVEYS